MSRFKGKSKRLGNTIFSIFLLGAVISLLLAFRVFWTAHNEDYSDLEAYLGVSIPSNISNLELDYKLGRLHYIDLSFEAPPKDIETFVSHFCEGRLYQGYNPFNAVNISDNLPDKNLSVRLMFGDDFTYYSYSENTPSTFYGNRCREKSHFSFILVDKTNPNLYTLRFEADLAPCYWGGWRENTSSPGCVGGSGQNYLVIDSKTMPFMIAGLGTENGDNVIVADGICVEARNHYIIFNQNGYLDFMGAEVNIYIDGILHDSTYISEYWRLEPDTEVWSGYLFKFCYWDDWRQTSHILSLEITKTDNTKVVKHTQFKPRIID